MAENYQKKELLGLMAQPENKCESRLAGGSLGLHRSSLPTRELFRSLRGLRYS